MTFYKLIDKIYDNIFYFNNTDILVLFDADNSVWMSYNDILKSIGYSDVKKLKKRIFIDTKYFSDFNTIYSSSKLNKIKELYQKPNEKLINESGIYLLLSKSSKQIAKQLSDKLFSEVLPELRKTGKFILNTTERDRLKKLTTKLKIKEKEIKRTIKQNYPDETKKGFIYILKVPTIHDGKHKTCHKIGYTANLEKRLATYKTGNPDVELAHHENLHCNKKQLEACVMSLNVLKRLKNRTEVICDVPLEKIKAEIEDCKKLLSKHIANHST